MLSYSRAFAALGLTLVISVPAIASTTPIAYEGFAYTPNGVLLAGQNGGTGTWTGAWAENVDTSESGPNDTVLTSGLTYSSSGQSLLTSGGLLHSTGVSSDDTRTFNPSGNTVLYYSFLLRHDSLGNQGSTADYGGLVINGTNAGTDLFVGDPGENNFISIGQAGTGTGEVSSSTTLAMNTVAFLVARVTLNTTNGAADSLRLYINPTPCSLEASNTDFIDKNNLDIGTAFTGVELISGFNAGWTFDELRIGDSFAAVTPAPEPSSVGLLAIAASGLLLRRRRRTQSTQGI